MPRFVILRHEFPPGHPRPSHWDLMLEFGAALRTWVLAVEPFVIGTTIDAQQIADHRLEYLDYEGPVSGDRGSVRRFDSGQFVVVREASDELCVTLSGGRLRGDLTLTRSESGGHFWRVSFSAAPTRGGSSTGST